MLKFPLEVGNEYVTRDGRIEEIINIEGNVAEYATGVVFAHSGRANYDYEEPHRDDIISDYIEPDKEITYNKKELLQAILNDKTLQFRVDENETWQDVADNDWVLRMIADKSKFCFRVKPETIKISDGEIAYGDMVWWHCDSGPVYESITDKEGSWKNAQRHPNVYSIKEPEFEMVKVYKYMRKD